MQFHSLLVVLFLAVTVSAARLNPLNPKVGNAADLQSLLAMTRGLTSGRDPSWTSSVPACQWAGVACTGSGAVANISWTPALLNGQLTGVINFTATPSGVQQLQISEHQLTGTVDTRSLPAGLQALDIHGNQGLRGPLALNTLPSGLQALVAGGNQFSGVSNFNALPSSLSALILSFNRLQGTVPWSSLPAGLQQLYLDGNQYSGPIDFGALPASLAVLSLTSNAFTSLVVSSSTASNTNLQVVYLNGNNLGTVNWNALFTTNVTALAEFTARGAGLRGPLDLSSVPASSNPFGSGIVLDLSSNSLSGPLVFTNVNMFQSSYGLNVAYNNFTGPLDLSGANVVIAQLDVAGNQLSGTPNFGSNSVQGIVEVGHNQFCGTFSVTGQQCSTKYPVLYSTAACRGGVSPTVTCTSGTTATYVCPAC